MGEVFFILMDGGIEMKVNYFAFMLMLGACLLLGCDDDSDDPDPEVMTIDGVTFLDKGAVVPEPVTTTVIMTSGAIEHVSYQSGKVIDRWSQEIESSDFDSIEKIIQDYNLFQRGDVEPGEGQEPCVGWDGMTVTINGSGSAHSFDISGNACYDDQWPDGVRVLIDRKEELVEKYQPEAISVNKVTFFDKGGTVLNPISTTLAITPGSIEYVSSQSGSVIHRWSKDIESSDFDSIENIIQDYNLFQRGDVQLGEGQQPCDGMYGMTVTISGRENSNSFDIAGNTCYSGLPDGVQALVDLEDELVQKYQQDPVSISEVTFLDEGAVVPNPISTTIILRSDRIEYATAQSDKIINQWSKEIDPSHFDAVAQIIRDYNLFRSRDFQYGQWEYNCPPGNLGMTITINGTESYRSSYNFICYDQTPDGVQVLVDQIYELVQNYQQDPVGINEVTFLDKGAVVPDPISTTITFQSDTIDYATAQSDEIISQWSKEIDPSDFNAVAQIVRDYNLFRSSDFQYAYREYACPPGDMGMTITINGTENYQSFYNFVCYGQTPEGVQSLVDLKDALFQKYQ